MDIHPNIPVEQTTRRSGRNPLLLAAAGSFIVAALHATMPFFLPEAYRFFGGPGQINFADKGAELVIVVECYCLSAIFAVWGLYALSGAGVLRRLPLLRLGLLVIGGVYTLRGLLLIQEIIASLQGKMQGIEYQMCFSVVSLLIGIFYLAGIIRAWKDLSQLNSRPGK